MLRVPTKTTPTVHLFPYTTLFRSVDTGAAGRGVPAARRRGLSPPRGGRLGRRPTGLWSWHRTQLTEGCPVPARNVDRRITPNPCATEHGKHTRSERR